MERTFVLIKPDGIRRGLVGEIIAVMERAGLAIIAMKMIHQKAEVIQRHYPDSDEWLSIVGGKTLEGYQMVGLDAKAELGIDEPREIGKLVKSWLVEYLTSDRTVAMVVEGNQAVRNVRRLCGNTLPVLADPGTIRGRFGVDSPDLANAEHRPVHNLIHASGTKDEAAFEIELWFGSQIG